MVKSKKQKLPKTCIKIEDPKYKSRSSPPYHANDCPNVILEGNDENQYISMPDKNGVYHWKKIKYGKNAEDYYSQFPDYTKPKYDIKSTLEKLDKIKKELEKHNIYLFFIGWKNVTWFIDYAWEDAEEMAKSTKLGKKIMSDNTNKFTSVFDKISFLFFTDHRIYWTRRNGEIFMQHNILKKDKDVVIQIFKKYFGNKFVWDGKPQHAILIKVTDLKSNT